MGLRYREICGAALERDVWGCVIGRRVGLRYREMCGAVL